jgi:hypothetical protein
VRLLNEPRWRTGKDSVGRRSVPRAEADDAPPDMKRKG